MHTWIRFLNQSEHSVIYIKTMDYSPPITAINGIFSKYVLVCSGSTYFEIYDNRNHLCANIPIFLFPGKVSTIILN